jgi:alpha-1,2-mannosyltransferase
MKLFKKYFPLLFFLFTFLLISKVILNNGYPDFSNFYFGPLNYHNGINPYIANKNLFTPTTYPPIIFLFFYPLTFLNLIFAEKLWTLLSILALICSLFFLLKIYNQKINSPIGLILSSLVFLSFPVKFTLGMGQINIFILLLISLFIYFHNKSKNYSAIFLGISILFKFFPFLMIFYFLVKKQWKIFILLCFTIISGALLSLILIKSDINWFYVQKILPTLLESWKGDYYNQSLSGLLTRFDLSQNLRVILRDSMSFILLFCSFLIIFLKQHKDKLNINLEISLIITLSLLINSFSWQHHFVWMTIPFFATFFYLKNKKTSLYYYLVLGVCYIMISWNFKNPQDYPILLQSHVFFGTLAMWFLQIYLLFKNSVKDNRNTTSKKLIK